LIKNGILFVTRIENLLCEGDGESMVIKIADFGLSKVFSPGQQLETSCGVNFHYLDSVITNF
jgi:hypothetical protein